MGTLDNHVAAFRAAALTMAPEILSAADSGSAGKGAFSARLANRLMSVKLRVALASLASLAIGIGAITALIAMRAERDLLASQRHRELAESVRTAEILSHRLVHLQRAIQTAARQLEIRGLKDDQALSRYLESKDVLRSLFSGIFMVAPSGEMRWLIDESGLRPVKVDLSHRFYVQQTLRERRPVISEPLRSLVSGDWIVMLTAPVYDGDKQLRSILCGNLKLASREFLDDLAERSTGANVLTLVADSNGRILAPATNTDSLKNVASEPRLGEAYKAWVARGSPLEPSGLELNQPGQMVTAAGVPGTDWIVWRASSEEDLLQPLRDARRYAVTWALALVSALSAMLLGLLWWLLNPLTELRRRAAHAIDRAMPPEVGWPTCRGELGELSAVLREGAVERQRLESQKEHLLKMLSSALDSAPIGIAFVSEDRFELVSRGFCAVLGLERSDLLGASIETIFAGGTLPELRPSGSPTPCGWSGEWLMQRADGVQFWGQLKCNALDAADPGVGSIWTLSDVTSQRHAQLELEWAATHDSLTGLANRKLFEYRTTRLVDALPRSVPAAIVCLDLDRFKPINDREGHAAGDAMLAAVAGLLTASIRPGDVAARIGGDEFALLLERCEPAVALKIAENVCRDIADLGIPWGETQLKVGASAGVAHLHTRVSQAADWVAAADRACYAAKAAGRGVVRVAGG